jgi:transposase
VPGLADKGAIEMAYTKAFKEQAMRLVTEREYTPTAAARELGMPMNTLNNWLNKAGWRPPAKGSRDPVRPGGDGGELSDVPAVLKIRVKQLEEEVRRLRTEKDILKKATAFFAREQP